MWHSNGSSQNAFHGCWSRNRGLKMVPPHLPSQRLILFFVRFFMILTWDIPHFWTNPFIFLVFLGSYHSPFFGSQFLGHGQCSNPLPNMVLYACAISACPHDRTSPKKSLDTSRRDETRLGRIHIIFLRDDVDKRGLFNQGYLHNPHHISWVYLTKINGAWEYVWSMLVRAGFFHHIEPTKTWGFNQQEY